MKRDIIMMLAASCVTMAKSPWGFDLRGIFDAVFYGAAVYLALLAVTYGQG